MPRKTKTLSASDSVETPRRNPGPSYWLFKIELWFSAWNLEVFWPQIPSPDGFHHTPITRRCSLWVSIRLRLDRSRTPRSQWGGRV